MSPGFEFVDLGFVGIQTFCKFPFTKDLKDVQIAIVGAPLDQGTFNRPGARYGPRGIREASQMYGSGFIPEQGFFDAELGRYKLAKTKIIDYGDIPVAPTLIEENLEMITDSIKRIVEHGVCYQLF
jgi:agmatinase